MLMQCHNIKLLLTSDELSTEFFFEEVIFVAALQPSCWVFKVSTNFDTGIGTLGGARNCIIPLEIFSTCLGGEAARLESKSKINMSFGKTDIFVLKNKMKNK